MNLVELVRNYFDLHNHENLITDMWKYDRINDDINTTIYVSIYYFDQNKYPYEIRIIESKLYNDNSVYSSIFYFNDKAEIDGRFIELMNSLDIYDEFIEDIQLELNEKL